MILNGLCPVDLRKAISNSLLQRKPNAIIGYLEQLEAKNWFGAELTVLRNILYHATSHHPFLRILPFFEQILNELLSMSLSTNQSSIFGNFRPVLGGDNLKKQISLWIRVSTSDQALTEKMKHGFIKQAAKRETYSSNGRAWILSRMRMGYISTKDYGRAITDQRNSPWQGINKHCIPSSNFNINFQSHISHILLAHLEDMLSQAALRHNAEFGLTDALQITCDGKLEGNDD